MFNLVILTDLTALTDTVDFIVSDCNVVAIDTETTGLDSHTSEVRLIQICVSSDDLYFTQVFVIDTWAFKDPSDRAGMIVQLLRICHNTTIAKAFFSAKFDLNMLRSLGVTCYLPIYDTSVMYRIATNGKGESYPTLIDIKAEILEMDIDVKAAKKDKKKMQRSPWSNPLLTHEQIEYAAEDAFYTYGAFHVLYSMLVNQGLLHIYENIEQMAVIATADMEYTGIPVDRSVFARLKAKLTPERDAAKAEVLRLFHKAGAKIENLNSPKQLLAAFACVGVELTSTAATVLEEIDHPVVDQLLDYRTKTKLLEFVDGLPTFINPATGRIHCSFNQMGTVTGRYSSSNPNLQNIPRPIGDAKELRDFIAASPGHTIVKADFSQIELVIAAERTQDPVMCQAYREGKDIHRITAAAVLGKSLEEVTKEDRQAAKAVNFGFIFGMGAVKFKLYAKNSYKVVMTLEEAYHARQVFFDTYQGIAEWHRRSSWEVKQHNTIATATLSGRQRQFSRRKISANSITFTSYVNTQVQGTNGDINKVALGLMHPDFAPKGIRKILQVHDEIVLEVPNEFVDYAKEKLEYYMVTAGKMFIHTVPVKVEVTTGQTWGQAS